MNEEREIEKKWNQAILRRHLELAAKIDGVQEALMIIAEKQGIARAEMKAAIKASYDDSLQRRLLRAENIDPHLSGELDRRPMPGTNPSSD